MPAAWKTQDQSVNIVSCHRGDLLTLGAGFRGWDMSETATALQRRGYVSEAGCTLFPVPGLSVSVMELVGGAWAVHTFKR